MFRKGAVQLDGSRWVWGRGEAAEWPWCLMRVFRRNHEQSNGPKIILEGSSGLPSFSQHVLYESARRKTVGIVAVQEIKRWTILWSYGARRKLERQQQNVAFVAGTNHTMR
eukprot:scaffold432_cov69-Cyclotella_meneghiniana.AAC.27